MICLQHQHPFTNFPLCIQTQEFVSSNTNSITANTGTQYTPSIVDYISSTGELIITLGDNHGLTAGNVVEIANATYNPTSGAMTITAGVLTNGHGFSNGDYVKIKDHSITFTCDMDNNATNHTYPRPSDPISGKWVTISNVTQFTFDINVGASPEVTFTPSFAEYDPTTGLMEITIGTHTLEPGTSIKLDQESIKFTCDLDDNNAERHILELLIHSTILQSTLSLLLIQLSQFKL